MFTISKIVGILAGTAILTVLAITLLASCVLGLFIFTFQLF